MKVLRKLGFSLATLAAATLPIVLLAILPGWALLAALALLVAWMAFTRMGRQTRAVAAVGIATLPQRLGASSVIVIGIAGVVGVLVALLAMGAGFDATLKQTGSDDTVIVMASGAQSEIQSLLNRETVAAIAHAPQVLQNLSGETIVSPELVVSASFQKRVAGEASVEIRGVGERVWELRPNVKIIAGRAIKPGLAELLIGRRVSERFSGMNPGSPQLVNGQKWTVVGTFDSGDAHNSEIWADAGALASAFHRGSNISSVTVQLTQATAFDAFKGQLMSDPRLKVDLQTTRQYYNRQSEAVAPMIRTLGLTVGIIMAIGAMFGALNTMYAAIATRAREIATLRAIGFQGGSVVVSVMLETLLLAMCGGALGAAITWVIFDGFTASSMGILFAFKVSPTLLWNGIKWALAIGLIGGLFPAIRAARMPITVGLREI
jgi:putative ABC transport system permease protein